MEGQPILHIGPAKKLVMGPKIIGALPSMLTGTFQ